MIVMKRTNSDDTEKDAANNEEEGSNHISNNHVTDESNDDGNLKYQFNQFKKEITSRMNQLENDIRSEIEQLKQELFVRTREDLKHLKVDKPRDTKTVDSSTQTFFDEEIEENDSLMLKLDSKINSLKEFIEKQLANITQKLDNNISLGNTARNLNLGSRDFAVTSFNKSEKIPRLESRSVPSTISKYSNITQDFMEKQNERVPFTRSLSNSDSIIHRSELWSPINDNTSSNIVIHRSNPISSPYQVNPVYSSMYKNMSSISSMITKDMQSHRENYANKLIENALLEQKVHSVDNMPNNPLRLEPQQTEIIRNAIFSRYPVSNLENEDELWNLICDKMYSKSLDLSSALKRKHKQYQSLLQPLNESVIENVTTKRYKSIDNNTQFSPDSDSVSSPDSTTNIASTSEISVVRYGENIVEDQIVMKPIKQKGVTTSIESEMHSIEQISKQPKTEPIRHEDLSVTSDNLASPVIEKNGYVAETNENPVSDETSALIISKTKQLNQLACISKYQHGIASESGNSEKNIQYNREDLCRSLVESMFSRSTLANSNVTGARGKFMLDPVKIAKVREIVFTTFPAKNLEDEEQMWRILTNKINTKCRGVKRLMKRNGLLSESFEKLTNKVTWAPTQIMHSGNSNIFPPKSTMSFDSKYSIMRRSSFPSLSDESNEEREYLPDYYYSNNDQSLKKQHVDILRKKLAHDLHKTFCKSSNTDILDTEKMSHIKETLFKKYPAKEDETEQTWNEIFLSFKRYTTSYFHAVYLTYNTMVGRIQKPDKLFDSQNTSLISA